MKQLLKDENIEVEVYQLPKVLNWMGKAVTWRRKIYLLKGYTPGDWTLRHEMIHAKQQEELGMIKFVLIYCISWLWNILRFKKECYRNIVLEREAYSCAPTPFYLQTRPEKAYKQFWV